MPAAAILEKVGDSTTIRVSRQHQITIPAAARERYGFKEYALCTFTEEGILIQPIEVADSDEDLTLSLMRWLIGKGYEGEELLQKYEEIKPKFISYNRMITEAEDDVQAGRVTAWEELCDEIRDSYGI